MPYRPGAALQTCAGKVATHSARNSICAIDVVYGLFTKQHVYYILYLPKCIDARALLRHCTVPASEHMGLEHRSLVCVYSLCFRFIV